MRAEIWTYKVVGHTYKGEDIVHLLQLKATHDLRLNMSHIGKMLENVKATRCNLMVVKPKLYDEFSRTVTGTQMDPASVKLRQDLHGLSEEYIVVVR